MWGSNFSKSGLGRLYKDGVFEHRLKRSWGARGEKRLSGTGKSEWPGPAAGVPGCPRRSR